MLSRGGQGFVEVGGTLSAVGCWLLAVNWELSAACQYSVRSISEWYNTAAEAIVQLHVIRHLYRNNGTYNAHHRCSSIHLSSFSKTGNFSP